MAVSYRLRATKLLVLVQLLMGDVPERTMFAQRDLEAGLAPYFHLTRAVRVGEISVFNEVVTSNTHLWEKDGVTSLIVR